MKLNVVKCGQIWVNVGKCGQSTPYKMTITNMVIFEWVNIYMCV